LNRAFPFAALPRAPVETAAGIIEHARVQPWQAWRERPAKLQYLTASLVDCTAAISRDAVPIVRTMQATRPAGSIRGDSAG